MPVSTHRTSPSASARSVRQQRAGDVAVDRPRAGRPGGRASPARSGRARWPRRRARRRGAGTWRSGRSGGRPGTSRACTSAIACSVIHSAWRRQASSSGVFVSRDGAHHLARRPRRPLGEQDRRGRGASRPSLVDGDRRVRPGRARRARSANSCDAFVEGRGRSGRAGGRRRGRARRRASARNGVNRWGISSSARTTATGRSTLPRPASPSGQIAPVAYDDVGVAEQDERVECPCRPSPRGAGRRARGASAARSGCAGRSSRVDAECDGGTHQPSRPEERHHVGADDLHGGLGSDRVDHAGERLLASTRTCSRCAGSPPTTSPGRRRSGRSARARADRP